MLAHAALRVVALSGLVAFAAYTMSLSSTAAVIAGLVAGAVLVLGVVAYATWWDVDPAVVFGNIERRRTWPWMVVGAVFVVFGWLILIPSGWQTRGWDQVACLATGLVSILLGWSAFSGGLSVRIRRFRRVLRAHPTFRQWFIGLAFAGGMLLTFGLGGFSSVAGLRAHGVRTDAVVTHVTHFKGVDNYFLRYRVGSRMVTCSTEDVLEEPSEGETITVLYDSTDPTVNCQSADYGTGYGESVGFTVAGAGLLLPAFVGYFVVRRKPTTERYAQRGALVRTPRHRRLP